MYTFLVAALAATCLAVDPVVDVGYTSYRGVENPAGVSQWLGMRFAAPPVGDLRFAAPAAPPRSDGVQDADKHGPICLAVGSSNFTAQSEDCLFLDVYAPSNASPTSKLPVFFFIQGGGYASNSNPNLNGTGLITAGDMQMLVVTFNYRVGPYGFLAGAQVPSLNNGLKDHYAALNWVQQHIAAFGGDPAHVVIGGDSAGAQSVTQLLTAYGGKDLGLFVGSAAESQSFPTQFTRDDSQFAYDNLVITTGCSNTTAASADDDGTLACLRSLDVHTFQQYNKVNTPFPGAPSEPLYLYGPTLDNDIIQDYAYNLLRDGKVIQIPTIFGDDANGGTVFVPNNTYNYSQSNTFLRDQFPLLTLADFQRLNTLYTPDNVQDLLIPVNNTYAQQFGGFYSQLAKNYGDMRYTCPGIYASSVFSNVTGCKSWNYLYNVSDPTDAARGLGVPHTTELNAIFGPSNIFGGGAPKSYSPGQVNEAIVPLMQGYWTSFVRFLDPNVQKAEGAAEWEEYVSGDKRLVLAGKGGEDSESLVVDEMQMERCEFLWSIGARVHQ